MTIEKIHQYLQGIKPETPEEQHELDFAFPKFEATIRNNHTFVGGYVVFPIIVNVSYQTWENRRRLPDEATDLPDELPMPTSIEVKLLSDVTVGHIYFSNNEQVVSETDMSVAKMCAYLVDVANESFEYRIHKLTQDYLVIEEHYYTDYISLYKKSSILWGGLP